MEEIVELFEKLQEELHDKLVNLSDFVIKEEIGKGATGIVYLATSSKTNQLVAIKESKYQALNERQLTLYCNEIQVLSKCYNHPFLLKFIGFTNRFPYTIITEHIPNGSLWNALHYSIEPLTGDQKNKIAIGIAAGMAALHDQNIIHRDLKSLNVLLDNDYLPVICDFGASKLLDIDSDEPTSPTNRVGTLAWMAPELFTNSTFSNKVDVYSFAVLLWELETCQVPFKGVKSEQIPEMVVNQERPPIPTTAPISLKKLIRLCWHPNPDKRPTFSAILDKFLHKKVYFEGATDSSIHFIQEKLENWKRTIDITLKETRNNSVEHVKQIFLKQDSKEILQYIEGLNENNCRTFYSVILEMIESEEATTILLPALYGLLYIITENEKCLLQYVEIDDFIKLPFNRNELKEISLSILIPIFEKYPNSISLELIYTLKSLIQFNSIKICRLFSIIINNDSNVNNEMKKFVTELLLNESEKFIMNGAEKIVLQTIFRLILNNFDFFEDKINECKRIFELCLSSDDNNIIDYTYSIIFTLYKNSMSIELCSKLLSRHLSDEKNAILALKYIAITDVINDINVELMEKILFKYDDTKWSELAYLKLCEKCKFDENFVEHFNEVLSHEFNVNFKIQILILLLSNSSFRKEFTKIKCTFAVLLNYIKENVTNDRKPLKIINEILQRIEIDEILINEIKDSEFIKFYLEEVIKLNKMKYYKFAYEIIGKIAKFKYLEEFNCLIPIAQKHLEIDSDIKEDAEMFLKLTEKI